MAIPTQITITTSLDIQNAIDSIESTGGVVMLSPGTYTLSAIINIPSNVILQGSGPEETIVDCNGDAYYIRAIGSNGYSTGTVAITNNTTAVVGTGTTWTAEMVGRSILLQDFWYEITVFTDATGGYQVALGGTATATSLMSIFESIDFDTNSYLADKNTSIVGGFDYPAGPTNVLVRIQGSLVCNAGGTFYIAFGQHAASGTSSVLVDSSLTVLDSN